MKKIKDIISVLVVRIIVVAVVATCILIPVMFLVFYDKDR